jgi:NIMA (never in mitosis gene a)-related kinase
VGDLGITSVREAWRHGEHSYWHSLLYEPYNYKSDVWALDCCVYEMDNLKHAFNAKVMNSLVYQIIKGKLHQSQEFIVQSWKN